MGLIESLGDLSLTWLLADWMKDLEIGLEMLGSSRLDNHATDPRFLALNMNQGLKHKA